MYYVYGWWLLSRGWPASKGGGEGECPPSPPAPKWNPVYTLYMETNQIDTAWINLQKLYCCCPGRNHGLEDSDQTERSTFVHCTCTYKPYVPVHCTCICIWMSIGGASIGHTCNRVGGYIYAGLWHLSVVTTTDQRMPCGRIISATFAFLRLGHK